MLQEMKSNILFEKNPNDIYNIIAKMILIYLEKNMLEFFCSF